MGQASPFLRRVSHGFGHYCPACDELHVIQVNAPGGPNWTFNGDVNVPTFEPSVRVSYSGPDAGRTRADGSRAPSACCHYFLRDGQLQFCSDSTHPLAGQTVPLPELPDDWKD